MAVYWGLYKDKVTQDKILLFKNTSFIIAQFELICRNGCADIYLIAKEYCENINHLEYLNEA